MDESDLIARARRGDLDAYERLVRVYQDAAFRAAYLITRDADEAQDAAQEAFLRAFDALGRFDTRRPFRPWLLRIVTNLALNRLKAAQRRHAMVLRFGSTHAGDAAGIEGQVLRREHRQQVLDAIGRLAPEEQRLVYLRYFLELSEAELSQAFGVAAGTIKSRLHRALSRLRGVLGEHAGEPGAESAGEPR